MINRRSVLAGLATTAMVAPAAAQQKLPLLAILSPASRDANVVRLVNEPFKEALARLGYKPGGNIDIVERFADNDESRLPALAAELVAMQPNVLFTNTSLAATVVAHATRTIPIVVGPAGEHVLIQLAGGSLARPTTNVTGLVLTSPDIDSKNLALLLEAVPSARRIGMLVNPRNPGHADYPATQFLALGAAEVSLVRLESGGAADIDAALAKALLERIDALFVTDDAHLAAHLPVRQRVLRFAASNRIPVASSHQNYARDGALLGLGPTIPVLAAAAARYVDQILKGTRPAELPVQLPTVFTTIVNLKTAASLGLIIPPSILLRADEVIE